MVISFSPHASVCSCCAWGVGEESFAWTSFSPSPLPNQSSVIWRCAVSVGGARRRQATVTEPVSRAPETPRAGPGPQDWHGGSSERRLSDRGCYQYGLPRIPRGGEWIGILRRRSVVGESLRCSDVSEGVGTLGHGRVNEVPVARPRTSDSKASPRSSGRPKRTPGGPTAPGLGRRRDETPAFRPGVLPKRTPADPPGW